MKFSCGKCNAKYLMTDATIGSKGVKVRCKKCGNVIVVKPAAAAATAVTRVTPSPFNAPTEAMSAAQLAVLKADAAAATLRESVSTTEPATSAFSAPTVSTASPFDNPFESQVTEPNAPKVTLPDDTQAERSEPEAREPEANSGDPAAAGAPAASGADGVREWYVAIGEAQIGPVDLREVEARWDAGELSEEGLVWRAGLADWTPVADVSDLAYLITEHPQGQPRTASGASPGASAAATPSAPETLGAVAFGGSNIDLADIAWKPSAASALSALVQDELAARPRPVEAAGRTGTVLVDMDMPSFAGIEGAPRPEHDVLARSESRGAVPAFDLPVADPFSASQSWSLPKPRTGFGITPTAVMLALMGTLVVVLTVVLVVTLSRQRVAPPVAPAGQPHLLAAVTSPSTAGVPSGDAAGVRATTTEAEHHPDAASGSRPRPSRTVKPVGGSSGKSPRTPTTRNVMEDILNDKHSAEPSVPPSPSREDVLSGVKTNIKTILPCLQAAKSKGELNAGKHTLVLDFLIRPDGGVSEARLTGPSYVTGTSMPGCFAAKMRAWHFPASKNGAPVKNYPLPFTI